MTATILEKTSFIQPAESPHSYQLSLDQKIYLVVLDCVRIFQCLLLGNLYTLNWMVQNLQYHQGNNAFGLDLFPSINRKILFSNGGMEQIIDTYQEIKKFSTQERAITNIERLFSRGCCHGECLTLVELLQDNPDAHLAEVAQKLSLHKDKIAYYQTIEICESLFYKHNRGQEIEQHVMETSKPKERIDFSKAGNRAMLTTALKRELSESNDQTLVVRSCGFKPKARSHTVLLRVCPEKGEFAIYNSLTGGVHNFASLDQLIAQTLETMDNHVSGLSQNALWQLESYG